MHTFIKLTESGSKDIKAIQKIHISNANKCFLVLSIHKTIRGEKSTMVSTKILVTL